MTVRKIRSRVGIALALLVVLAFSFPEPALSKDSTVIRESFDIKPSKVAQDGSYAEVPKIQIGKSLKANLQAVFTERWPSSEKTTLMLVGNIKNQSSEELWYGYHAIFQNENGEAIAVLQNGHQLKPGKSIMAGPSTVAVPIDRIKSITKIQIIYYEW